MPFYGSNTPFTNITNTSKFALYRREKWLVLPTTRATQSTTVEVGAQKSALSDQPLHHRTGKSRVVTPKSGYKSINALSLRSRTVSCEPLFLSSLGK
jgi:hypothetical protein